MTKNVNRKDPTDTREAKLGSFVSYKPCEPSDWGVVLVMDGQHKGKIGYYDDDEDNKAIVYFGVFGPSTPRANIAVDKLARLPDDFCSFLTMDKAAGAAFQMLGVRQNFTAPDDED